MSLRCHHPSSPPQQAHNRSHVSSIVPFGRKDAAQLRCWQLLSRQLAWDPSRLQWGPFGVLTMAQTRRLLLTQTNTRDSCCFSCLVIRIIKPAASIGLDVAAQTRGSHKAIVGGQKLKRTLDPRPHLIQARQLNQEHLMHPNCLPVK